jgi:hypothetical protein
MMPTFAIAGFKAGIVLRIYRYGLVLEGYARLFHLLLDQAAEGE